MEWKRKYEYQLDNQQKVYFDANARMWIDLIIILHHLNCILLMKSWMSCYVMGVLDVPIEKLIGTD